MLNTVAASRRDLVMILDINERGQRIAISRDYARF